MTDENTQGKMSATLTKYVVLELNDVSPDVQPIEMWKEVATISGTGQEKTLIENWAAEAKQTGTFKLVPARSWKGGVRVFEKTELTSEAIA